MGSKLGIPSPLGVQDPVALRALIAIKEAVERLSAQVDSLNYTLEKSGQEVVPILPRANALPNNVGQAPRFSSDKDVCGND
jgi:hypothetical protein